MKFPFQKPENSRRDTDGFIRSGARGFTLIELLVVISIIGLLMSILLPAMAAARATTRSVQCLSNLRQIGLASSMNVDEHKGQFWEYSTNGSLGGVAGVYWWFGFEAGGPGTGTGRPLDVTQNVLAHYASITPDNFQCPDFPFNSSGYYPKFQVRAATYAYNWKLSGLQAVGSSWIPSSTIPPEYRRMYDNRASSVAMFADGVQFDGAGGPGHFNEGAYLNDEAAGSTLGGFAHFRHSGQAMVVYIDCHAAGQRLTGPANNTAAGSAAGDLVAADGSNAIYGY